jgi:mRNA-degrading endonuclease RelE of RelBE toxin-antitoxin system
MYKITFLPGAEDSFKKLDKPVQKRIAQKIDWLAENAEEMIHHPLASLPEDLRGLCRMRLGGYRNHLLGLRRDQAYKNLRY